MTDLERYEAYGKLYHMGYSDGVIAKITGSGKSSVHRWRERCGFIPNFAPHSLEAANAGRVVIPWTLRLYIYGASGWWHGRRERQKPQLTVICCA